MIFIVTRLGDGRVYSCGIGDQGQLGMGHAHVDYLDTPTLIEGLVNHKVTALSCGITHSGVISGENEMSQILCALYSRACSVSILLFTLLVSAHSWLVHTPG